MKRNTMKAAVLFLVLAFAFSLSVSSAAAAKGVTIIGKVEHGKIVTDSGRTYTLRHNVRGRELITDHTGQRVEVHGWLSKTRSQDILHVDRINHIYG